MGLSYETVLYTGNAWDNLQFISVQAELGRAANLDELYDSKQKFAWTLSSLVINGIISNFLKLYEIIYTNIIT